MNLNLDNVHLDNVLGQALTSSVQLAYLTNNTSAALKNLEGHFSLGSWETLDVTLTLVDGPNGAPIESRLRASLALMPGRMFEVVEPLKPAPPLFPALEGPNVVVQAHHIGAFMNDADIIVDGATRAGLPFYRYRGARGEIVFVDTRESTGLWLEALCFPFPGIGSLAASE